ncbi:MAG: ABC transporter ATP-binding protein [Methyloligellaceae bacterium]
MLLQINNLEVEFPARQGNTLALRGITFNLKAGERLGIVGESGAGKSMVAFSILNLVSKPGRISRGSIIFENQDLVQLDANTMRAIRGGRISMVFQDPMMTLNPVFTIGQQMVETLRAHREISYDEAMRLSIEKLSEVSIPSPEERFKSYPHELSGGMLQRVVIAIALLTEPALIIADEPTTALDVTIQAEILRLLLDVCKNHRMGLILISHDIAVVSQVTERMIVMYAGKTVEEGDTDLICRQPGHPYTRGLIASLPERNRRGEMLYQIPGTMPSPLNVSETGCAFAPRCSFGDNLCVSETPAMRKVNNRNIRCFYADTIHNKSVTENE